MTVLRPPLVLSAKEAKRLVADAHGAELTVELSMPRLQWPALAKALGAAPRPHITALTVRCLEGAPVVAPGRPMISGKANHALWDALPNLQELTLVGHALAAELAHEGLTSLSMEGFSLTKSLSKADADLPSLTTLVWAFGGDEHGVAVGPSALKGLFKGTGTPRLTDVDLGSADIDGDLLRSPTFVKGTLLPRLRRFVFPMGALDDAGFAKQHEALAGLQSIVLVGDELGSDDPRITRVHRLTPASVHPIGIDAHLAWGLGDEQVAATVEALTTRTVRQFLTGAHDVCQQAGALGAGLAAHAELEHLDLSRPLTRGLADQAGAFFAALGPHPSLATVELFRNHLQGQLGALGEAAARWPALRSLDVGMTRTEAEDLSALFAGLARSSTLQRLQAGANRQGPEVDEAWASLRSTSLTELRAIRMGCGGLASLHDRLPALTRLDVTTTPKAEPIDGAALAVALDGRPMDRVAFELAVSDHGVDGLAQLLAAVPVRELHLELEGADAGAYARLAEVLTTARQLNCLSLDGRVPCEVLVAVLEALGSTGCEAVVGLWPKGAPSAEEAARIAAAVRGSHVRGFHRCGYKWAPALAREGLVHELTVGHRYWFDDHAETLRQAIAAAPGLRRLRLEGTAPLMAATVGLDGLECLELAPVGVPALVDLLQKVARKGGPREVVAEVNASDVACRELLTWASEGPVALTLLPTVATT